MVDYPVFESRKSYAVLTAEAIGWRCRDLLWEIVPGLPGELMKAWVRRAAAATGLTTSQVKRLHYQEMRSVPAHIALWLEQVAAEQDAARERGKALKAENDSLLAAYRAGVGTDGRSAACGGSMDAPASGATLDPDVGGTS